MAFTEQDIECMSLALKLSQFGRSDVGANPMVGCVITRDDEIIAQDYHQLYGDGHAEINALNQINHEADNTKLYVTLEPCSHYGKTPPCVDELINAGVKKVFIAMLDPNPLVSGKGIKILQDAGVAVDVGLLEDEAKDLNRGFIKRMQTGMPFVTSKIAMSIDGKIAMKSGESKWITSEASREDVQLLRANYDAILTGTNTFLNDNPRMDVRLDYVVHQPEKILLSEVLIADHHLDTLEVIYNLSRIYDCLLYTSPSPRDRG